MRLCFIFSFIQKIVCFLAQLVRSNTAVKFIEMQKLGHAFPLSPSLLTFSVKNRKKTVLFYGFLSGSQGKNVGKISPRTASLRLCLVLYALMLAQAAARNRFTLQNSLFGIGYSWPSLPPTK